MKKKFYVIGMRQEVVHTKVPGDESFDIVKHIYDRENTDIVLVDMRMLEEGQV